MPDKHPAGQNPMNREAVYLVGAALLPLCNRFQEVSIKHHGVEKYRYVVYNQVPICVICLAVCLALLAVMARNSRLAGQSLYRALPIRYSLFALPALFGLWQGSGFGDDAWRTEITSGIGGPYAWALLLAAGLTFICVEGYFRQIKNLK